MLKKVFKTISEIPKQTVLLLIRVYQKLFSFDHSFWARPDIFRICMFYPSCSEYAYQAINRFGLIKGGILGTWRVIRCNPFSHSGIDEVPEKFGFQNKQKY